MRRYQLEHVVLMGVIGERKEEVKAVSGSQGEASVLGPL